MTEPPTKWVEISLTVEGEWAEAVAEVMARFIPNGVAIESTAIEDDPVGEGYPTGPLRVCGYIPNDGRLEETRRNLEKALWYLGRIQPLPSPQYQPIQDKDWTLAWKANFHPIPVGRKLLILPAWMEAPSPDRIPIFIDPGMAFGTGTHPTTQLCLEFLEAHVQPDDTLIDVGCGSGVLAISGIKLGAHVALGVDTDPDAIANARTNARINGVSDRLVLEVGSAAEVRQGAFRLRSARLVLVNILAPVIVNLLSKGLTDLVDPDGWLILSGLLAKQETEVLAAIVAADLTVRQRRQVKDWIALGVTR